MPTISVIVPVYKVEKYLHRCVDSILAQTFRDFELILVDDGSPDNCGAICDEYALRDERIVVIHQENGGLSAARNAGLDWMFANSDSQWVSFVDSDDWIHPQMLEQLLKMNLELGTQISVCEHIRTDGTDCEIPEEEKTPLLYTPEEFFEKYCWVAVLAWGKLYNRSCFETLRYPVGKCYEDTFTSHHILFSKERIAMLWLPYYFYYTNPESITQRKWTKQRLDYFEAMKDRIFFFEERGFRELVRRNVTAYVSLCFRQLAQVIAAEDPSQRRIYRKVIYRELVWGLKYCVKVKAYPKIPFGEYIQWLKRRMRIAKIEQ